MIINNAREIKRGQGQYGEYVIVGFTDDKGQQYTSFAELLLDIEPGTDVPGKVIVEEKNTGKFDDQGQPIKKIYRNFKPSKNVDPAALGIPLKKPQTAPHATNTEKPDWDKIAEGKVRHGLVCAMIQAGWQYDQITQELPRLTALVMGNTPADDVEVGPF